MNEPRESTIVVLTPAQLKTIVTEAVQAALASQPQPSSDDGDVISREAAAGIVGVHFKTIPKLVEKDGLPTLRKVRNQWRFSRRAVLAWMAEQSRQSK